MSLLPNSTGVRLAVALIALCALIGVAVASSGGQAYAGAGAHLDADDAEGPLDLAAATVRQKGKKLVLSLSTRGRLRLRHLSRGPVPGLTKAYACFDLSQQQVMKRACAYSSRKGAVVSVARVHSPLGEAKRPRRLGDATVSRPTLHSLRIVARPRGLGLGTGRFQWNAITGWDAPRCVGSSLCLDALPDFRLLRSRWRRPHVIRCRPAHNLAYTNGSRTRREIALTFDDGPSAYTSHVLDILHQRHAHGTFFVLGSEIPGRGSLLRRMLADGQMIGDHSMHHEMYPSEASIAETAARIEDATGFDPCLFRPPYGALNGDEARAAQREGMTTILWDVDPQDWSNPGTAAIESRVLSHARAGSIVLMHDGGGNRSQTVAALPTIIRTLHDRGYRLVTVTHLLRQRLIWGPR